VTNSTKKTENNTSSHPTKYANPAKTLKPTSSGKAETTMTKEAEIPIGPFTTMTVKLTENDYIPENSKTQKVET